MKAKPSFNILLRVVLRVVRHPSGIAVRAYRSGARNASDGSPQPDASKQFQQEWCKALPVACAMSGERTCRSVRNRRISRKQKACRRVVHMQSPGAALARPLSGGSPSIRAGGRTAKSPRHRIGRRPPQGFRPSSRSNRHRPCASSVRTVPTHAAAIRCIRVVAPSGKGTKQRLRDKPPLLSGSAYSEKIPRKRGRGGIKRGCPKRIRQPLSESGFRSFLRGPTSFLQPQIVTRERERTADQCAQEIEYLGRHPAP